MILSLVSSKVTLQLSDSSALRPVLNSRDFGNGRFFYKSFLLTTSKISLIVLFWEVMSRKIKKAGSVKENAEALTKVLPQAHKANLNEPPEGNQPMASSQLGHLSGLFLTARKRKSNYSICLTSPCYGLLIKEFLCDHSVLGSLLDPQSTGVLNLLFV